MAEASYPFTGSSITTEVEWCRMTRRWGLNGVHADTTGTTNLKVTGNGSAVVTVGAGRAYVNGFFYRLDATASVSVTANAGGSARVDLVILRCSQADNSIIAVYKTGGTVAPDLTQDEEGIYEIPLAQCTVAAGSSVVTAANVLDLRYYTGKGVAPSLASARRPATAGQLIVEGNEIYLGDGTNWNWVATAGSKTPDTYSPVWTAGSTSIDWGSGTVNVGRYKLLGGNLCWVKIHLIPGGNPPSMTDPISVSLPFTIQGGSRDLFSAHLESSNGEGLRNGTGLTLPSVASKAISRIRINNTAGGADNWLTNDPINCRTGDIFTLTGTYEIA